MADTTVLIIFSVSAAVILLAIALGLCLCRVYGVFGSKSRVPELYPDHIPLEFKKSYFSLSPVIKTGTHFELMIGTKPRHRLELSHIDSDAMLMLQMKSDVSTVSREIYLNSLETIRRLEKHDHVTTLYGSYETSQGPCAVIEYAQFGTLKYYLSYSSYKTFYDYRGFNDDDDTFGNMRPPESLNSLQRKRNLFAYPKIVMESRKTPLSALTLYFLMWQICLGMEFLHLRNFIHGSLCSFNVLVTGHLTLKINCFSMAFEDKYALNAIPRWMAPEVFITKALTKPTDVWSFGVTMWELFNCGAIPYNHLTVDEVVEQTRTGEFQLTPPPGDITVSRLFSECFNLYPHYRPSFSQIRLVLERLLEGSEVALTNKFIDNRRLQYANTELLDKIFFDQQEVNRVTREEEAQRALYFTLPSVPGETPGGLPMTGSMSRIPITLPPADFSLPHDVTYASHVDCQNGSLGTGRNTGATLDLLSTSSAEFEDLSTTESEEDREYNNLASTLHPLQQARPSGRMRRVSSLNDLTNFRRTLQLRTPDMERPQSVAQFNKGFGMRMRSYSSDEYEDADELYKKRGNHSSLRKLGSALHASFRRMRQRGKEESGYETLPGQNESWEKRSFKNFLLGSKKWMGSKSPVPKSRSPLIGSVTGLKKVSQSETCLLIPSMRTGPCEEINYPPTANTTRTVSVSSGFSIPISVYSDYEIPDEVLEASLLQHDLAQDPLTHQLHSTPSNSSLSVNTLHIPKSRSAQNISNVGTDTVVLRKRANSHDQHDKHLSCLIDYAPSSPRLNKTKRSTSTRGLLSRSFNRKKQVKSISDILGTPPAVPTDRRPSILCTCCNSVHVCQTLPGMSLTAGSRSLTPNSTTSSSSRLYENMRHADYDYETLPGSRETTDQTVSDYETLPCTVQEDEDTDYEDVDEEEETSQSLTYVTSTLTHVTSPDCVTMTSPECVTLERDAVTWSELSSPGEIAVPLEL